MTKYTNEHNTRQCTIAATTQQLRSDIVRLCAPIRTFATQRTQKVLSWDLTDVMNQQDIDKHAIHNNLENRKE